MTLVRLIVRLPHGRTNNIVARVIGQRVGCALR